MPSPVVTQFRELHASGCFIMPNPWDAGSARFLETLGFKALASTSSGMAFSRALPDRVTALTREAVLAHLVELVRATSLPLTADFQSSYADDADGVAGSVGLCGRT